MQLRHEFEDGIGGWANDPRPLRWRLAEVVGEGLLRLVSAIAALVAIGWLFSRITPS